MYNNPVIKLIFFVTLVLTLILSLVGGGCSSIDADHVITITYDATFDGETPQGNLNLTIEMTVKNMGYKTFDASPSNFLVKIDDYSYQVQESQMELSEISDGEELRGKLIYQVPPKAATPRVGFSMAYSGRNRYNLKWVKSSTVRNVDSESSPMIRIAYTTELMWIASPPPGIPYLEIDPQGNLYLVVKMKIDNLGYETFNINPDYFSVEASSVLRSVVSEVQSELIDWRELNIQNSGSYTGSLLFKVPVEIAQSFYKWDYKMMYSGLRSYNIEWIKLNISKCNFDPVRTELDSVSLDDGESIRGKIAFIIFPDLASENAVYKLLYAREKSTHNVQFFDKPSSVNDINRNPIAYPVIKVTYSTNIERQENTGRLYLIVDVLIENKGYENFYTAPVNFYLEVTYKAP